MGPTSLILDVLVHLMTFVDRKTLMVLMLACKFLNGEAAKELIRCGARVTGHRSI
ncbi:hypothetical protein PYCCODRAFT_1437761 [Trametes coccinea BRFM310]|uniref:F-box domain-containing protein n=1 Tax=Trametes coccinea (strain BRFM310) TaxID=1353009 RepID=A0A1Y2IFN5_TRAC3|nr:hypothetical protein PYCCODRAFT_1437761 [Trametes coccinea BRFM310]